MFLAASSVSLPNAPSLLSMLPCLLIRLLVLELSEKQAYKERVMSIERIPQIMPLFMSCFVLLGKVIEIQAGIFTCKHKEEGGLGVV